MPRPNAVRTRSFGKAEQKRREPKQKQQTRFQPSLLRRSKNSGSFKNISKIAKPHRKTNKSKTVRFAEQLEIIDQLSKPIMKKTRSRSIHSDGTVLIEDEAMDLRNLVKKTEDMHLGSHLVCDGACGASYEHWSIVSYMLPGGIKHFEVLEPGEEDVSWPPCDTKYIHVYPQEQDGYLSDSNYSETSTVVDDFATPPTFPSRAETERWIAELIK